MRLNNKGITLITLIITVIILAIITGVVVTFSSNFTQTAKFETIETDLLLIRSKCKIRVERYVMGDIDGELIGTRQESGEYAGWYLLSQEDLNDIGLKNAKEENNYYVNYKLEEGEEEEEVDVAYGRGIYFNGQTFYKLSEILSYKGK